MSWTSLGNICKDLVLKLAGEKYRFLALIALSWREIVGDLLAERSTPEKYEHHVLFVRVANPTWMQELVLIKPQIIDRMNERLNLQVNEIIFLAGNKYANK
jgi:predicted nucleic acid-binding Zn ribbon protein